MIRIQGQAWHQFFKLTSILFFSAVLSVLLPLGVSTGQASAPADSQLEGESLKSGKKVSLKIINENSKGTVLVFLSAQCPCSNSHLPVLKKLSEEHKDFQFIGIHSNADESQVMAEGHFKKMDLPFEVIQDDHSKLADRYHAFKTPHVFVLNQSGEVAYQGGVTNSSDAGKADRQYLGEALTDIALGNKVRTPEGRTLGCMISREGEKNAW